jgi:hypothetical protein
MGLEATGTQRERHWSGAGTPLLVVEQVPNIGDSGNPAARNHVSEDKSSHQRHRLPNVHIADVAGGRADHVYVSSAIDPSGLEGVHPIPLVINLPLLPDGNLDYRDSAALGSTADSRFLSPATVIMHRHWHHVPSALAPCGD